MPNFFSKFKSFLFSFLIFSGVFFAACTSPLPFPRSESLVVAIPQAPFSLDPRVAKDAEGQKIAALLYDGLVALNEKQEVLPLLAEKWERVGPLTVRFHLRRGVKFSSGQELSVKDVGCTLEHILDSKNLSPLRSEMEKLRFEAGENQTFFLHLKEPYAPFFILLRKGIVSCDGHSGTGPYVLEEHLPQKRVVLKANDDYFGGKPKIKYLVFEVVKDDTTRVLKLLNHEVDLVQNAIPALLIPKILENKKIRMATTTGTTFAYLGMNLRDPVLRRKEVRQALAYALNRDEVVRYLWRGFSTPADSLLSPGHWAYAKDLPSYEHRLSKAKELLREAGATGFSLTLKTSTVRERIEIAKLLAHQLNQAGFNVRVQPNDWGILFRDITRGNFQLYTSTWVGVVEPDLYYNLLHSSQFPPNGSNRNFFMNARADHLTEEGRKILETENRKPVYHEIQKMVQEELPFIPLWYENNVVLYWNDLKEVTLTPEPNYRNFTLIKYQ